jgi:putative ABC transport system permease protein
LLAIVIGGVLAPQVRQIAVMKAIGARTHQIVGMYLTLVLLLALGALIVGLPIGVFAGKWLASYVVDLLNFNIESGSVPNSVLGACILLGFAAPLLAALWPIVAAARKSVRASIDYYGVSSNAGNRWLTRLCNRIRFKNVSAQLALRNLSRRKAQLLLAMSLLVLTGAVFMVAGNLLGLWRNVTSASIAEQLSDIQVMLRSPEPEAAVNEAIMSVAGVRIVEPARVQWANIDDGDGFSFSTRSLPLSAVVTGSELLKLDVQTGRWLLAEDENAVVLNSAAATNVFAHAKVGDEISLLVNRKPLRLLVVGIARDMFNSAAAYTTQTAFSKVFDSKGLVRNVRVGVQAGVDASVTANAIEQALAARNLPARGAFTKAESSASITAHTYIFVAMMLLIVVSVAKIAVAGLASCMSTAVIERTREFGVMRTLGARAHDIQNSIILEALMIGLMSWLIALLLATPLTWWLGRLLSATLNRQLPLVFSPTVALLWLVGVVLVATIASVAPAKRAAGLTIRQTLAQT